MGYMHKVKVFLASSATLKEYRDAIDREVSRKNKELIDRGIFLELVIWEDLELRLQLTRSQDAYSKEIEKCDIFILLASGRLGEYSKEEFDVAYKIFKSDGKPSIYIFIDKDTPDGFEKLGINRLTKEFAKELEKLQKKVIP